MPRTKILLSIPVSMVLAGCAAQSQGLADNDASFKIPAMKEAVSDHDRGAPAQLVEALKSDDPAVRFYAIESLRRLTGETFGYRYYDDIVTRQPAVDRWNAWIAEHKS